VLTIGKRIIRDRPYAKARKKAPLSRTMRFTSFSASYGPALGTIRQIGQAADKAVDVAKGPLQHTKHSLNQKINREVKSVDEMDAVKNPLKTTDVKYDSQGRPSEKFIGEKATVAVNPETGKVVTIHPTSSKLAERLKRQKGGEQ
jgi:hypothetical protein